MSSTSDVTDFFRAHLDRPWDWTNLSVQDNRGALLEALSHQENWYFAISDEAIRRRDAISKIARVRAHLRTFDLPNRWRLTRMVQTRAFMEWWYDPEQGGGKLAKQAIERSIADVAKLKL